MKKTALLKKTELTKKLKALKEWSLNTKGTFISRTFTFKDHINALVFIARATVHAQVLDHHPDIEFTFKKVKVTLTSHDLKGLTQKDIDLAERIDAITKGG